MLSDKDMFRRMERGWRGGIPDGTICGQGSTRACTTNARRWLPKMVKKYDIRSINDAGAGDLHWIRRIDWAVDYKGYDLIPRKDSVQRLDITTESMRPADAILCRMVLNHLGDEGDDFTRVEMALKRFAEVSKYLFATHFEGGGKQRERQFMRLDLSNWIGEPLDMCQDGPESTCRLAIWKL